MTGVLTDNMELEANIEQQRLEDLLGQEAVKMGQTILLIQVGDRDRVRVCSVNNVPLSGPDSGGLRPDGGEDYRGGPPVARPVVFYDQLYDVINQWKMIIDKCWCHVT